MTIHLVGFFSTCEQSDESWTLNKVRSFTHRAEELKIIKITCDQENNCTEQKLRPPADNLILLREERRLFFAQLQTFQISCSRLGEDAVASSQWGRRKRKKPEENPTHKKNCLIRWEISIHVKLILKLNIYCWDMRACQILYVSCAIPAPQTQEQSL